MDSKAKTVDEITQIILDFDWWDYGLDDMPLDEGAQDWARYLAEQIVGE